MAWGEIMSAAISGIVMAIVFAPLVIWSKRRDRKTAERDDKRNSARAKAEIERQREEERATERSVAEAMKRQRDGQ